MLATYATFANAASDKFAVQKAGNPLQYLFDCSIYLIAVGTWRFFTLKVPIRKLLKTISSFSCPS